MGWIPKSRRAKDAAEGGSGSRSMTDEEIERRLGDIRRAVGGRTTPLDNPAEEIERPRRAS